MKRSILSRKCAWFLAIALAAPTMVSPVALAADAKEVKLDAAQQDAATKLRAKGASVMQIAADTDALEVNLSILGKQANDDDLALVKMLPKVTQLNLRNTSITDKGLANIAGFIALTQLHLDGTGITDAGLVHLKGLAALDYLNLYNTAVTDDGLKSLDGLKKLKHVYLWQTKVTVAGGKALKSALPELIINRGEELTLPPPATKPAEVKPADVKPGDPKPADPKPVKNPKKKKPDAVPAAAAAIPDVDEEGYIRTWLVLGPIGVEGGADLDKEQVAGEKDLKPKEGDKIKVAGKDMAWKKVQAKEYFIDFNELLVAEGKDNVAVYAVAFVESPAEKAGLTLLMGSNDQGKVYLNGKEVVKFADSRTLEKDSDKAANVTLVKGTNVVVFKVINEANNWQGCLRFTDKGGKPVKDVKIKSAP